MRHGPYVLIDDRALWDEHAVVDVIFDAGVRDPERRERIHAVRLLQDKPDVGQLARVFPGRQAVSPDNTIYLLLGLALHIWVLHQVEDEERHGRRGLASQISSGKSSGRQKEADKSQTHCVISCDENGGSRALDIFHSKFALGNGVGFLLKSGNPVVREESTVQMACLANTAGQRAVPSTSACHPQSVAIPSAARKP